MKHEIMSGLKGVMSSWAKGSLIEVTTLFNTNYQHIQPESDNRI